MITTEQLHAHFLRSTGACTDTRQLKEGAMFFALKGPNFNANSLAGQALDRGCAFAVVDDPAVAQDERYLLVPDVLKALQELARHHRRRFQLPVIGITGTNGKTTTKELMHAVLGADRATLATSGNLNNHIGVPLTLLRLTEAHRITIIEMGANHVGDIAELAAIAEPTHGLITNIGRAHLEGFGSYEGVIAAKTELYAFLRATGGTAFVHADDALLMQHSEDLERCTYGTRNGSTLQGEARSTGPFLSLVFHAANEPERTVRTRLIGDYNLANALAAACVGRFFGVSADTIVQALEAYAPDNNRSQFTDTGRNQLVLDAYNANPSSMKVALENFAAMRTDRPKRAVLGDMLELGTESTTEHQRIVDLIGQLGIDALLVGPEFGRTSGGSAKRYDHANEALAALQAEKPNGLLILVKGSRGIKLETVVPAL